MGRGSAQKTARITASSPRSTEMNREETSFKTCGGPEIKKNIQISNYIFFDVVKNKTGASLGHNGGQ